MEEFNLFIEIHFKKCENLTFFIYKKYNIIAKLYLIKPNLGNWNLTRRDYHNVLVMFP